MILSVYLFKMVIYMWYLYQYIPLKWSFEYAQIVHLRVIFVSTHLFKMVIWICKNYFLHVIFLLIHSTKWSFQYAQIVDLHVIFVPIHSTKMIIWICTNYSFTCDICVNTFIWMVIWICKNYLFTCDICVNTYI